MFTVKMRWLQVSAFAKVETCSHLILIARIVDFQADLSAVDNSENCRLSLNQGKIGSAWSLGSRGFVSWFTAANYWRSGLFPHQELTSVYNFCSL